MIRGEYQYDGIKASPLTSSYRNKMEFSFGDEVKDGPLALGMHKRGSFYDIVTVDQCLLVHEDCCRILRATLDYFKEKNVSFLKENEPPGIFKTPSGPPGNEDRGDPGGSCDHDADCGFLGGKGDRGGAFGGWKQILLALPLSGSFAGILHTKNDSLADAVLNDGTDVLYGQDYFYEELLGLKFKITPFSFFQTNSLGAEVLYDTVRQYIGDTSGQKVFDLYSGTRDHRPDPGAGGGACYWSGDRRRSRGGGQRERCPQRAFQL